MAGDVKRVRGTRTRITRRKIVTAAAELFVAEGYHATTLEQIAARAGVAVQTVYFHFGNKRSVLKEAVDVAAVGDDEPVAMLDRPWLEEARAEPDPRRVIELWMGYGRGIMTRVGPIMRVVRDAAVVDPEMAEQWATNEAQTAAAFRVLAEQLDALQCPAGAGRRGHRHPLRPLRPQHVPRARRPRLDHRQQWERFVVDTLTHALLR